MNECYLHDEKYIVLLTRLQPLNLAKQCSAGLLRRYNCRNIVIKCLKYKIRNVETGIG